MCLIATYKTQTSTLLNTFFYCVNGSWCLHMCWRGKVNLILTGKASAMRTPAYTDPEPPSILQSCRYFASKSATQTHTDISFTEALRNVLITILHLTLTLCSEMASGSSLASRLKTDGHLVFWGKDKTVLRSDSSK